MFEAARGPRERSYVTATTELAAELSSPGLTKRVARIARELVAADHASVVLIDESGELRDVATSGIDFERRASRGSLDASVVGPAFSRGESVRTPARAGDPALFGLPRDHGDVSVLAVPIVFGEEFRGAVWLTRDLGSQPFEQEDEDLLKAFTTQVAMAVEITRLRQPAGASKPLLEASREIANSILSGVPTEDVLRLVAEWSVKLSGAAVATIAIPTGQVCEIPIAAGRLREWLEGFRFALSGSVAGDVMRTGRPHLTDAATDRRINQPPTHRDLGPIALAPMFAAGRVFGTLAVANEAGGRMFTTDDLAVLETFAAAAGVAIEQGEARRRLERLALLEDRERIAMELHDGVIQALFVVGLSLQAAEETTDDPDETRRAVEEAVESIDRTIRDLRHYIYGLTPDDLADRHLERALRELVDDAERSGRVTTDVQLEPEAAAAVVERSSDVIQVTREALSNALKHSGAQHISVRLRRSGGDVVLEVADDGRGFDASAVRGTGRGLGNLRTRAKALRGSLEINSAPDLGTSIRIRMSA